MDFLTTVNGSLLDGFYPKGWDLKKIDECCDKGVAREDFWHKDFNPIECENIYEFDTLMGHEIALQVKLAGERGEKLAMILPVGPMGMYKWAAYFLNEWDVDCSHVYTFNMDEWADAEGNTLDNTNPASFEYSMKQAFFGKINKTVPECQRNFATKTNLPTYPEKIAAQSSFSSSVSAECATSHSGSLTSLTSSLPSTSGRHSATASAQSFIPSPSSRTLSPASRAVPPSFLAPPTPSAPVSSFRLITSSAAATAHSVAVWAGRA